MACSGNRPVAAALACKAVDTTEKAAMEARMQTDRTAQGRRTGTNELHLQLQGYRLTTAEILYHLPDHPAVLQSFIWQQLDIAPRFPVLRRFLDFWEREIEGRLHSVRVASVGIVSAAEWRQMAHLTHLH
jgi:uncharacterized protein Usg